MKIYNERKAQRAINYAKILSDKVSVIRKYTGLERIESAINDINYASVAISCPTCHHVHCIPIDSFKHEKYRRQCYTCYEKDTDNRNRDAFKRAKDALGADYIAGHVQISDAPRHCIYLCMPARNYNKP
jgi:hypothetical protein